MYGDGWILIVIVNDLVDIKLVLSLLSICIYIVIKFSLFIIIVIFWRCRYVCIRVYSWNIVCCVIFV